MSESRQFDNTNSGALFKNDKKESDKHPDYKGSINVNGTEFWLSSWLKKSKAGATYMSLSVQPKDDAPAKPAQKKASASVDEDLPFAARGMWD